MILSLETLDWAAFALRKPVPTDAAISIGNRGGRIPESLSDYQPNLRVEFADTEPANAHRFHLTATDCLTISQADTIADFLRRLHSLPTGHHLVIHCTAGVSRSPAVGAVAAAYAGAPLHGPRDLSRANRHVIHLLAERLRIPVPSLERTPAGLRRNSATWR